jgi:hypothetical protein
LVAGQFWLGSTKIFVFNCVALPQMTQTDEWTSKLLAIRGIEEVVVMPEQQVAYIKVDKQRIDDAGRQDLTHLIGKEVAI